MAALTAEQKEQNRSLLIILMMLCSIGALLLFDHGVLSKLCPNVVALWKLRHLPEHRIGDNFEGPAILRGTIETTDTERNTPAGNPSVLYYAWVEDHYRSGKSTTVRVICNIGEDEKLVFRQGASTVPFELFHHDEHIALLKKDGWLESLPMQRVAIDLGRVTELTTVPSSMKERCKDGLYKRGTLYYKEARITSSQPMVVVACQQDGVLRSCPPGSVVPGILALGSLGRVLRAFAELPLNWLRGPALLLVIVMGYLCSALLKHSGGDS